MPQPQNRCGTCRPPCMHDTHGSSRMPLPAHACTAHGSSLCRALMHGRRALPRCLAPWLTSSAAWRRPQHHCCPRRPRPPMPRGAWPARAPNASRCRRWRRAAPQPPRSPTRPSPARRRRAAAAAFDGNWRQMRIGRYSGRISSSATQQRSAAAPCMQEQHCRAAAWEPRWREMRAVPRLVNECLTEGTLQWPSSRPQRGRRHFSAPCPSGTAAGPAVAFVRVALRSPSWCGNRLFSHCAVRVIRAPPPASSRHQVIRAPPPASSRHQVIRAPPPASSDQHHQSRLQHHQHHQEHARPR